MPASVPLRGVRGQTIEGEVLVRDRVERAGADPREELAEAGRPREVGPEGEDVREQPDRSLQLHSATVVDRGADDEVVLTGVPVQQRLERREHRHEEGGSLLATELPQRGGELRRNSPPQPFTTHCRCRRAWPVAGQLKRERRARELPSPVL